MNIPEGWKLVPVEPTPAMTAAYAVAAEELTKRHLLSGSYPATWQPVEAGYAAMLSAAPTPPAQDDEALEVLRELVEARYQFTGAKDPQAIRSAVQRIRTAEAAARALLTKRGAA